MTRHITQRELRNETPAIMRAIESGESFVLTRNGTPIADLVPHARPPKTRRASGKDLMTAAARLPRIDVKKFWADLERAVDYDPLRGPGEPERPETPA